MSVDRHAGQGQFGIRLPVGGDQPAFGHQIPFEAVRALEGDLTTLSELADAREQMGVVTAAHLDVKAQRHGPGEHSVLLEDPGEGGDPAAPVARDARRSGHLLVGEPAGAGVQ
nr:hypothetical protein [Streptomyces spinoverrucosus]